MTGTESDTAPPMMVWPKQAIMAGLPAEEGERLWADMVNTWAVHGYVLREDGTLTKASSTKDATQ